MTEPAATAGRTSGHSGRGRLRVLVVTPRFHPEVGGVETHVREVCTRLAAHGVDVTVLTTHLGDRLPDREEVAGVPVRRVQAWRSAGDARVAPGLWRAIAATRSDVIHVQSYHTLVAPLAMAAARRARVPYVVSFHGGGHSSWARNAIRPLQVRALAPLLRSGQRLVAVAEFEVAHYGRMLGVPASRFAVIPNGAELPLPAPRHGPRAPLVASVGRLERYKGHHRVLDAMPAVLAKRADARLWIAGDGPCAADLHRRVAELGLTGQVEIGAVPAHERVRMGERLSEVSVVALMSEWETHPIAALEALYAGARLVVAESPGLSDLVSAGHARGVPVDAPTDEIAAAILTELDAGPPGTAPALPTWDDCAAGLARLYREIARR